MYNAFLQVHDRLVTRDDECNVVRFYEIIARAEPHQSEGEQWLVIDYQLIYLADEEMYVCKWKCIPTYIYFYQETFCNV